VKLKTQISVENQINKVFGSFGSCYSTKVSFILSELDLSNLTPIVNKYIFPPEAMIKLYLFKRIKGISTYNGIEKYFNKFKYDALKIGFFRGDDNELLFPSKRTYNHFLQTKLTKEDINKLDQIAEKILSIATKSKVLLDIDIVKKVIKNYR